jgi:uncharacterized cupin superfamily protein
MEDTQPAVVNVDEAHVVEHLDGDHWGGYYKILTPSMRERGGSLGVNWMRLPPGRTAVPFHGHQLEDEVFFILSGRGVLRYGDELRQLRANDCVACPAGTGIAHQIANPYDEDLVYLSIGPHDPDEVCFYPDSGKVAVRSLRRIGWLENVEYMDGESDEPPIFKLIRDASIDD